MKITEVVCHVLVDPDYVVEATSSSQDDIVVEIHTDEGVSGIGEADVNPWVARACIESLGTHTMALGLTQMLIGADPMDVEGLWDRMYVGSAMTGRRGALIHSLGAVDMALHDLRGKALGKPCWQLLGALAQERVRPYASLQPDHSSLEAYVASVVQWARDSQAMGFGAAKLGLTFGGPYAHMGMREPFSRTTEAIEAVRSAVGPDFTLMVDVQYAFPDADTCLDVIVDWEAFDLFFVETPVASDDLDGYMRIATEQPIRIAAGEWLATRFEFLDLMDRGGVQVVQPDMGRVGGLTEAMRVASLARERGRLVVPHVWKTGISIAAALHLAAVTENCPFVEFLPAEMCDSDLRRDLVTGLPEVAEGTIEIPSAPGLGVELDRDALARFEEAAERIGQ